MNLGENIYRLRTSKNMSQGDLADALDVSRQSVSKWENNSATPELDKLIIMSKLFGVTLDEMVHSPAVFKKTVPTLRHRTPPRKIVGATMLASAFFVFLLFGLKYHLASAVLIALPFTLCGVICFAFRNYTGVWCGWSLYLTSAIIFPTVTGMIIPLSYNPENSIIGTLFIQIPLFTYTLYCFRKQIIRPTERSLALFALGCVLFLAYFTLRLYDTFADPAWKIWRIAIYLNPIHFGLFTTLAVTALQMKKD